MTTICEHPHCDNCRHVGKLSPASYLIVRYDSSVICASDEVEVSYPQLLCEGCAPELALRANDAVATFELKQIGGPKDE